MHRTAMALLVKLEKRDGPSLFNVEAIACALGDTMSLFGRKCAWCGEDVGNPSRVERMGKRFC